jgi:hypothetical protein
MPKLVLGVDQSHHSAAYLKARFRGLEFVASAAQSGSDHLIRPTFYVNDGFVGQSRPGMNDDSHMQVLDPLINGTSAIHDDFWSFREIRTVTEK